MIQFQYKSRSKSHGLQYCMFYIQKYNLSTHSFILNSGEGYVVMDIYTIYPRVAYSKKKIKNPPLEYFPSGQKYPHLFINPHFNFLINPISTKHRFIPGTN